MNMDSHTVNPSDILKLVRKLDFPRVLGSEGENKAFEIIKEELGSLNLRADYEEFASSWLEFNNSFIEIDKRQIPIEPLVNPLYSTKWGTNPQDSRNRGDVGRSFNSEEQCSIVYSS
jgi:hypothetical protein